MRNYPTHRMSPQARAFRDEVILRMLKSGYPYSSVATRLDTTYEVVKSVARKNGLTGSRTRSYYDSGDTNERQLD